MNTLYNPFPSLNKPRKRYAKPSKENSRQARLKSLGRPTQELNDFFAKLHKSKGIRGKEAEKVKSPKPAPAYKPMSLQLRKVNKSFLVKPRRAA